jgi:hypothetical protein
MMRWASTAPTQLELGLLPILGLPELLIDHIDPLQEALHRREQLILQPGDLLIPIGVIDPAAPQGLPLVSAQEPERRALAGPHQGNRIARTEARQLVRDMNSRRQMAQRRDAPTALSPCRRRSIKGAGVAATIGNR